MQDLVAETRHCLVSSIYLSKRKINIFSLSYFLITFAFPLRKMISNILLALTY